MNIQRQNSESGQQMVVMMARKRWGVGYWWKGKRVGTSVRTSGNKCRIQGEGGAEKNTAGSKQVDDIKGD